MESGCKELGKMKVEDNPDSIRLHGAGKKGVVQIPDAIKLQGAGKVRI